MYVGRCAKCLVVKASQPCGKGCLKPREPVAPWETVSIDLMGPYPRTSRGKRFILVATDIMSRWVEAFAVPNAEINTIAPIVECEVFMRCGYPRILLTDNAPQFRGNAWQTRCQAWGVLAHTTAAYHPQANPTERRNQDIKKGLRLSFASRTHRDWDSQLPAILFSLRRRANANTGQTPSHMLLGLHCRIPGSGALNFRKLYTIT